MNKINLALILLTLNLLCACTTTISREQFSRDLSQVVNDNAQMYKYFSKPAHYTDTEYQATLKGVLTDKDIETAIYDYAVNNHQASSSDTILSTDWARTFQRKGMLFLNDDDKKYFLEKIGLSLAKVPADKCEGFLKKELMDITLTGVDKTKVIEITLRALKSGAIAHDKMFEAPDKSKVGVALIALIAKAKEKMTDDEIEKYVKMAIERKPLPRENFCPSLSRLFVFATDLEPKYRNLLFNQLIFLHKQSL